MTDGVETCADCGPKLLQLAPGESYTCEGCGIEWTADDRGVQVTGEEVVSDD